MVNATFEYQKTGGVNYQVNVTIYHLCPRIACSHDNDHDTETRH